MVGSSDQVAVTVARPAGRVNPGKLAAAVGGRLHMATSHGQAGRRAAPTPRGALGGGIIATDDRDSTAAGIDPDLVDSLIGGADRSAYKALLRNRNYRLWFTAALTTSLGDWAGLFALLALVGHLTETGSRIALLSTGGILMARLLPSLIVGPVAGVLADRYDRKRLMVFTDFARGALFFAVAFSNDLFTLFTLTIVVELLSLLYIAAKDASLPTMVSRQHLTEASQLNLLATYGPLPVGALFATLMVGVAALAGFAGMAISPIRLVLLANAATFLVAGGIISRLRLPRRTPRPRQEEPPGILAELREGLLFIRDLPLIRSLILGVVGVFFGAGAVVSLGQQFVAAELRQGDSGWFMLMAAAGVGLVAGMLAMPLLTRIARKERLFPIGLALTGAMAIILAVMNSFGAVLLVTLLLGAAAGPSFVMGYTLLQEYTRDDIRARTFATFYTGTRVAMFAALGLAPLVAAGIGRFRIGAGARLYSISGLRITILLGGVVALLSAISAWRGMYRALRDEPERQVRLGAPRPAARKPGGVFVAFEGVEGSGKSTQVKALAEALESEGRTVIVTREPGGSAIAERIRQILLDPNSEGMHPVTEALLYAAARAEHVQRVIVPALEAGKDVICDRYLHSSLAYQGFARQLGEDDVLEVSRWATGDLLPDVVVLLHLDPEEGLGRVRERARRNRDAARGTRAIGPTATWGHDPAGDRLEREGIAFHRRVAEGYLKLAKRDRGRFIVVDAGADARTIARQIRSALHAWIPLPVRTSTGAVEQRRPEATG
ncbi:MAG TPA: dTMP kinase [Egibacteraceae bacterium]|nr:dTMP kinase [Egibacteraceae bacterium]